MSQFSNMDGVLLLQLSLPREKLANILKDLNYPEIEKIGDASFEQKRMIILVAFREFLKGKLFLEEFSEIASNIKMLFPTETRTPEQEDFEIMIYEAADMSLNVRTYNDKYENNFGGYMDSMWKYFNKYKHLLDRLTEKYSEPAPLEKK